MPKNKSGTNANAPGKHKTKGVCGGINQKATVCEEEAVNHPPSYKTHNVPC